jgi:2-polyprenyl-6-methoxyphenol hydroxylase-like FAD-dependent oxidoreductase
MRKRAAPGPIGETAMDHAQVLIVGAGPVGMLTAVALAQAGVDVVVAEAGGELNDSPRAAVYFSSTLIALEDLGLLRPLEERSFKVRSFGFHAPAFDFHPVLSMDVLSGITYDYQLHCGQDVVARVALERADALGARVLFGHRLIGLDQDAGGVVAEFETPEGRRTLRADWAIGADGARSTVRQLLGVEFEGHTWPNRFVATNVYADMTAYGFQQANFVCDPVFGGVVAQLDLEGLWRITYHEDAGLPAESFMERLPAKYAGFIPPGEPYRIKAATPYAIHQRCAERLRVGRVLLAGDAAHATNPCGGLGLTTGVWTGLIAADLLGAVIGGQEGEETLDRFSDERRRVFWEVTSPGASENKRMMEEADPGQRRKDVDGVRRMAEDPEVARLMMCFPFRVIGDVIREGSRWQGADPTARAGVAVATRSSQLA